MTQAAFVDHGTVIRSLAERWLRMVAEDSEVRAGGGDFVCSPAGLWLALTAVAAGARGETAQELRELLGAAGAEAAGSATAVARGLAATEALTVATGAWARTPVYRAFRESLPDIGVGQFDPADTAPVETWIREETGGLIGELPGTPDEDTLLMLVNALVLTGRWESPFPGADTGPARFTDASGGRHEVETMHQTLPPADAWAVGSTAVAELRCRAGSGRLPARARFVLGPHGASAAEVLPAAWAAEPARTAFDADEVRIALPRCSLRTSLDATGHLAGLGVHWATSDEADFAGMSPEPLKVGQVAQESVIKVAEKGVEAAAATAVMMAIPAGVARPRRIERIAFDRPFGVVVLDGSGSVPLFAGWQATAPVSP
ncbi:serpin family protein [Streptomyces gobiensis]|uniref:serpin family protein n=1 Tax=Streptomyces gobiensis TaxID=2875706 RepID=UPI001E3DF01C|nr:serpin family protein [Streptomyces gobiensis]UGY90820.1 serine protease [Streptomyces gobiensis]